MRFYYSMYLFLAVSVISCQTTEIKERETAEKYCGNCHLFPEPSLLPKNIWEDHVLPQMAFRMGLNYQLISKVPSYDQKMVYSMLPDNPMITQEKWEEIKSYFLKLAPDSLTSNQSDIPDTLTHFVQKNFKLSSTSALITLLKRDYTKKRLIAGTRNGQLFEMDFSYKLKDSIQQSSAVSYYQQVNDQEFWSLMGIMDPNDQPKGKIQMRTDGHVTTILDSLKRPVHFEIADFDNDQIQEVLVCEFGNFSGQLSAFKKIDDHRFKKISLVPNPGARKFEIIDWDLDGLLDIVVLMTQGDERLLLLKNNGNLNFTHSTLLRFPPVYGSSYFELQDLNKDGKQDIVYSNGDNGDYSVILKPYHGIRTFINDGNDQFNESWFYPMPGASEFRAIDFDKDGDLDFAAISFFPDFEKHPERGFIYFENVDGKYLPKTISSAKNGRWLVMETGDVNQDGYPDIILGALNFSSGVPRPLINEWTKRPIDILVLESKYPK